MKEIRIKLERLFENYFLMFNKNIHFATVKFILMSHSATQYITFCLKYSICKSFKILEFLFKQKDANGGTTFIIL
jgi:hypothetical protein